MISVQAKLDRNTYLNDEDGWVSMHEMYRETKRLMVRGERIMLGCSFHW